MFIPKHIIGAALMKKKNFIIIILSLVILIFLIFSDRGILVMKQLLNHKSNVTVVIDAGHGGFDPGKVGLNNALEKDINLKVAYKLKSLLEQNGINVIMTREDGNGLYKKTDKNKKLEDMKKRVAIINSSDALIAVSIHQNSFTQESSKGAQVFYYYKSEEGKILAEIIQGHMVTVLDENNHRLAKSNNAYFMLKYTNCPLVIVEGGFLSNWKEADLLCQDYYQEKIAWSIHLGILEYISKYHKFD